VETFSLGSKVLQTTGSRLSISYSKPRDSI